MSTSLRDALARYTKLRAGSKTRSATTPSTGTTVPMFAAYTAGINKESKAARIESENSARRLRGIDDNLIKNSKTPKSGTSRTIRHGIHVRQRFGDRLTSFYIRESRHGWPSPFNLFLHAEMPRSGITFAISLEGVPASL